MKPPRTLGLSLAILTSVMLFSLLPLSQIAVLGLIQYRVNSMNVPSPDGTDDLAPIAVGGEFMGISTPEIVFQLVSSVAFLMIAICAWRGRPHWIRLMLIGAVVALLLITVITSIVALNTEASLDNGLDSGQALSQPLVWGRLVISAVVALYVLWYMNRGPARAFYRGSYLQRDDEVDLTPSPNSGRGENPIQN